MEFLEEVKKAKEKSKKRNFIQTWDLVISLKNIDLKKPENNLNLEFSLPEGRGKDVKTVFIADSLLPEAKKHADLVITKGELEKLAGNKKKLKEYVREYEWWFAEAPMMPLVGKALGTVLGPKGKMPKPVPPKSSIEPFFLMAKRLVRIRLKGSPVMHIPVGSEKLSEEQVARNISSVVNFVKEKLPKGKANIKSVYIKLTMGPPVKLKV
jgi:large subunit ribosomal protein L1